MVMVGGEPVEVGVGEGNLKAIETVTFTIRPEKIILSRQAAGGPIGTVQDRVYIGTDTRYLIVLLSGEMVIVRVQNGYGSEAGEFAKGDRVMVRWSCEDARMLTD